MSLMPDFLDHRPTSTLEAAVASLQQLGIAADQVQVVPVGSLESFRGEIVGQVPAPGTALTADVEIVFYVSRPGVADRLPGDLLPSRPTVKDARHAALELDKADDYWEKQVAAYDSGRLLLTVIDRALGRLNRDLDRVEWSLSSLATDTTAARRSLDLLHLQDLPLTEAEQVMLAGQLQRLHEWIGPAGGIETLIERFAGIPAEIHERPGPWLETPPESRRPLGAADCRLGDGIALGPRFRDPRPTLVLQLGPVPLARFVALDRDEAWWAKVEALVKLTCPASCELEVELVLDAEDQSARLDDPLRGRLGRTTYLNPG